MTTDKRIPCIILCFYDLTAIQESLEFFSNFKDTLNLIVIENPSKYTEDKIKPFIMNMLKNDKIDFYYLMDDNISLNAVEMLLDSNVANWKNHDYIINAEGDITSTSTTWIEEEKNILDNNKKVLACGMGVDLESLKKIKEKGAYWYPKPIHIRKDYYHALTGGGHAVMWRTPEMIEFLKHIKKIDGRFIDNYMHPFCDDNGREWARTKNSEIRHFSWEYQLIDNHEYHNIKKTISWKELFHHGKYCNYTEYTKNGEKHMKNPYTKKMLHLGCGTKYFNGWINIDIDNQQADIKQDIRKGFSFANETIDYIYSEHFIEHLSLQEGLNLFKDCYRILKNGGVLRIAAPDLDYIIQACRPGNINWKDEIQLKQQGLDHIRSRAELINEAFSEWGHRYLYNQEEIYWALVQSGFSYNNINICKFDESSHADLKNRETRISSKLIVEATK